MVSTEYRISRNTCNLVGVLYQWRTKEDDGNRKIIDGFYFIIAHQTTADDHRYFNGSVEHPEEFTISRVESRVLTCLIASIALLKCFAILGLCLLFMVILEIR